jgi:hypothetical protein
MTMGCDIHIYCERYDGGRWVHCDTGDDLYDGRNYTLFAALADVRNRTGDAYSFAGGVSCDGGDPIPVIQPPKGIPDDVCQEIREHIDGGGEHSHSYYTLQELLDFDWHGTEIVNRGVVSSDEELDRIERMRAFHAKYSPEKADYVGPDCYCRATTQKDAKVVTWKSTLGIDCGEFLSSVIPKMSAMARTYDITYRDIRIVFCFDS